MLAGFARTGLYREVFHVVPGENPYALEIALIDDLKSDEVAVFGCCGSRRIAPWGELLSTASRARGAAGCVTDGMVRDVRAIRALRFPVFHGGIAPLDSKGRGKVAEIDVPIRCGGVAVAPGDLIVGDADGVVVVPQAIEDEALRQAFAKVTGENRTRDELAARREARRRLRPARHTLNRSQVRHPRRRPLQFHTGPRLPFDAMREAIVGRRPGHGDAASAARTASMRLRLTPMSLRPSREAERNWITSFTGSYQNSTSSTNFINGVVNWA